MLFEHNGRKYDTAMSSGEMSTNRLQLTDDPELKMSLVKAYFSDWKELLEHNELEVIFQWALMSAKYTDILEMTGSGFSKAGTYPDWVVDALERNAEELYGD